MSKLIGVFATEISSRVQSALYQKLHKKAIALGYNLVFFSANYERKGYSTTDTDAAELFELARSVDFAAILIHVQSLGNEMLVRGLISMGHEKDIPVFLYDAINEGFTTADGAICIDMNYKQGFAASVKHLIEHHHCKNIYMLAGVRDNKFSDDRIDAYREELEAHGMEFHREHVFYGDFWEVPAMEAIRGMLGSGLPIPDAICCANDSMAIAAIKTLEQNGYHVPGDILVTGFDGIEDGKYNYPVIASSEPNLDGVPDFFFDAIEKNLRTGEYLVPHDFVPQQSCGCEGASEIADRRELARMMEIGRENSWQHVMLSNMQLAIMDETDIAKCSDYMRGIMSVFKGFSNLYCIKDGIEGLSDLTGPFERVKVLMNMDFLPEKEYPAFRAEQLFPDGTNVFEQLGPEDMLIFRLVTAAEKKYCYCVSKTGFCHPNEIKIFGQFTDSFAVMLEAVLRNLRLEQATRKLNEMYERMSEISIRDMMTGLYNRHGYYSQLEEYVKRPDLENSYIHIVSIDMDDMKYINDNFGHLEGDNAIKAVAKTIEDCFAQPCICARFGGDEFMAILFTEEAEKPTQEKVSARLNTYLESFSTLQDKPYVVGVSVGHAVLRLQDVQDIKSLEKLADDSMYADKRKRKGDRIR